MVHGAMVHAMAAWRQAAAERKAAGVAVRRMRHGAQGAAFRTWVALSAAVKVARARLLHAARQLTHRAQGAAVRTWAFRASQRKLAASAAMRLRYGAQMAAFSQWVEEAAAVASANPLLM
eukprot:4804529-Prymnesium_polylepis.1